MQAAIIVDGKVFNLVEVDTLENDSWTLVPADASVKIGDLWDGSSFASEPTPPLPVPPSVTMRQARLALLAAGLLDDIDAAINSLPSPQKEAARIEWEYSQEVQRHNGFVSVLAPMLGMTDDQIDALFITAQGL